MTSEACATGCPSEDVIFPERMASSCANASEKPKTARKKNKNKRQVFHNTSNLHILMLCPRKTYKYKEKRILYIQNG